jgi:uncharacterized protein (DUF433 family)
MPAAPDLTFREIAELSGVTGAAVEKAVELKVIKPVTRKARLRGGATRYLPLNAVVYFAALKGANLIDLPIYHKRAIWTCIVRMKPSALASVEFTRGTTLDLCELAAEPMELAMRYLASRDAHIVSDPDILGGTPVIRGTRMSVYSVLGRLQDGDNLNDLVEDNPDIPKDAFEAAAIFARAHPLRGRPSGRPWRNAA